MTFVHLMDAKALPMLETDIMTSTSVGDLASVLADRGQYEEAEKLNRPALEWYEKELGVQHPDILTSVYCLAYLLYKQM